MTPSLSIYLSHVRVDLCCSEPQVAEAMRRTWGGCGTPLVQVEERTTYEVRSGPDYEVLQDGIPLARARRPDGVISLVDGSLYDRLLGWHSPGRVVLHAACITRDGQGVLLVGPSGSGKSTLAMTAVRRGWTYLTDEIAVTDGRRVWGIARAIQFDPVEIGTPLIPRLAGTAMWRWPGGDAEAGELAVPFFAPPQGSLTGSPVPAANVAVVQIGQGAGARLLARSPVETLGALHKASYGVPDLDLGGLVGTGRGWSLSWQEPEAALELLEGAMTL